MDRPPGHSPAPHPARSTRAYWIAGACTLAVAITFAVVATRPPHVPRPDPAMRQHVARRDTPVATSLFGRGRRDEGLDPRTAVEWKYYLKERDARKMFQMREGRREYDPWTYYRRTGNQRETMPWPEHPGGGWLLATNGDGLREAGEVEDLARADVRVLVAGDSHTYGVCNNDESFPNRIEAALRDRHPERSIEVLNAATDGFSFFQYAGLLNKYRDFDPQVFVVAVYGGNDFIEMAGLAHHFDGTRMPDWEREDYALRDRALRVAPTAMGQGFNAIQWFRKQPQEIAAMIATAVELCEEMQAVCLARRIAMVVVYLPSPADFAWPDGNLALERAARELGVTPEERRINERMGAALLEALRASGIRTVDMTPVFRLQPRPPYWRDDLHVDVTGHALTADTLLPRLVELLAL